MLICRRSLMVYKYTQSTRSTIWWDYVCKGYLKIAQQMWEFPLYTVLLIWNTDAVSLRRGGKSVHVCTQSKPLCTKPLLTGNTGTRWIRAGAAAVSTSSQEESHKTSAKGTARFFFPLLHFTITALMPLQSTEILKQSSVVGYTVLVITCDYSAYRTPQITYLTLSRIS